MDKLTANELRIGNLVTDEFYDSFKTTIKVESINEKGINLLIEDDGNWPEIAQRWIGVEYTFDKLRPIPLTEEWLLRLGFNCLHANNKHYIIIDPNGLKDLHKISIFPTLNEQWHIAFSDTLNGYQDYIPTTKIKYVHQLQNLYFALTVEELTITTN